MYLVSLPQLAVFAGRALVVIAGRPVADGRPLRMLAKTIVVAVVADAAAKETARAQGRWTPARIPGNDIVRHDDDDHRHQLRTKANSSFCQVTTLRRFKINRLRPYVPVRIYSGRSWWHPTD